MQPKVIVISVDYSNARKVAESIENMHFDSFVELRSELHKKLKFDDTIEEPMIYDLTDFMDLCNNQEINLELYMISYIFMKK